MRAETLFYLRVAKGGLDRTLNLENSRFMYIKENTSNISSCVLRVAKGGGGLAHNSCTEFSKLTLHVYRREDFK